MRLYCLFVVLCSVMTPVNIIVNGFNFKSLQENLLIALAVMNPDLALRVDSPPPLTNESIFNDKKDLEM